MSEREEPGFVQKLFSPKRILIPTIIGLGVVGILFYEQFDFDSFGVSFFTKAAFTSIAFAFLSNIVRDFAYVWRLMVMSQGNLSLKKSIQIILLWEFGSAATPSSVGGSSLAILLLAKEGISPGRSTAMVMYSVVLDTCFFVIAIPLVFLFYGKVALVPDISVAQSSAGADLISGLFGYFVIAYILLSLYGLLLIYGLFINPLVIKRLIYRIFGLKFLKRWRKKAIKAGSDLILTSAEIKNEGSRFWLKTISSTILAWSARFSTAIILLSLTGLELNELLMYSRQLIMQVITIVGPVPGGSGFAELSFSSFLSEWVPEHLEAGIILFWRFITYYFYLIVGLVILPRWITRHYGKKIKTV